MSIIEFQKVSRVYKSGDHELKALDNVEWSKIAWFFAFLINS